jgi:hypothetical protein
MACGPYTIQRSWTRVESCWTIFVVHMGFGIDFVYFFLFNYERPAALTLFHMLSTRTLSYYIGMPCKYSPLSCIVSDPTTNERIRIIGLIPIPETLSRGDLGYSGVRPANLFQRQSYYPILSTTGVDFDLPRQSACRRRNRRCIPDTSLTGRTLRIPPMGSRSIPTHHRYDRTSSCRNGPVWSEWV